MIEIVKESLQLLQKNNNIELVNKDAENKTYIREWLLAEYGVGTIKEISEDQEKLIKLYDMLNKI